MGSGGLGGEGCPSPFADGLLEAPHDYSSWPEQRLASKPRPAGQPRSRLEPIVLGWFHQAQVSSS